jgi:hypothetical protein
MCKNKEIEYLCAPKRVHGTLAKKTAPNVLGADMALACLNRVMRFYELCVGDANNHL